MKKKTYAAKAYCTNCGAHCHIEIAKGTVISAGLKWTVCPKCGCATLDEAFK